jgi:regulator of protease activity HflC (stomatin/prohibitin superfamily)
VSTLWQLLERFGRLFVWAVIIMPWEQGLRVRAGRRQAVLGPGVHLRIPYLDVVYRQSNRLRLVDISTQTVTTRDGKSLTIGAALAFSVADIQKLYQTLHHAEGTLLNLAAAAIADQVSRRSLVECEPMELAAAVTGLLHLESYGLQDGAVRITDFAAIRAHRLIVDKRWCVRDGELTP